MSYYAPDAPPEWSAATAFSHESRGPNHANDHDDDRWRRVCRGRVCEGVVAGASPMTAVATNRCDWASTPEMARYHDEEWGVPLRDDNALFEFLVLEGAQAGLSWATVLKKREAYREAFHGFEIARVARMADRDVERLLGDARLIRNRGKITSALGNAKVALQLQKEHGSLAAYLWSFVGGEPIVRVLRSMKEVPAQTAESEAMSKALKKAGMRFVGPTIMYAFMQATGMVNDHLVTCPRRAELLAS